VADRIRFRVAHDELGINRPANRLIRSALARLEPGVRSGENRLLLHELKAAFADVPEAEDLHADWRQHRIDRSMRHYGPVMQWVGLFLFDRGLATYSGQHVNLSLLFKMEQVFQDFMARCFQRYQNRYRVAVERPRKHLIDGKKVFWMEPDISLMDGKQVPFILDAKWKEIEACSDDQKHGIDQRDLYQLYAYGKRYGCRAVALVYPQTGTFETKLRYRFFDGLPLVCLPFDVTRPEGPGESVRRSIQALEEFAGRVGA